MGLPCPHGTPAILPAMSPSGEAIRELRRERVARAPLYFVCEARPGDEDPAALLDAALRGGAGVIQLRDKDVSDEGLIEAAGRFRAAADEHEALFVVNDRPDLLEACDADGVHVGQEDLPVGE